MGLGQASETEHTNLGGNVIPRAGSTAGLETLTQTTAHLQDTTAHGTQIILPLREENGVIQNAAGNAGAVRGRIGDLRALQDSQLASDVGIGGGSIRARGRDEVEGSCALTVQTEVLGEGLRDAQLEALLDEVADRPGVADQVARGEALVGGVEEGEVRALAHQRGDLAPLVLRGVDTGWVVCAGVQEDDGSSRRRPQRLEHAIEVKTLGFLGEVGVVGELKADVCEDLVVIGPGWVREVNGGLLRVKFGKE